VTDLPIKIIVDVRSVFVSDEERAQERRDRDRELHLLQSIATGIARIAALLESSRPGQPGPIAHLNFTAGQPIPEKK
jgi:hypothetical protein